MAFLEQFSAEERSLIVSLPYRAGLWVSTVDETGGGEADGRELQALEAIINKKARGMFESAFVHEIMAESFTRKGEWKQWAKELNKVPQDCERAIALISQKLVRRDVDAYRQNVMSIGVEVARAFREFDLNESLPVRIWTAIRLGIDKMIGSVKGEIYESETLLNISYEEDVALARLSASLSVGTEGDSIDGGGAA